MFLTATILSNISKMTEILKVPKSWKIKKGMDKAGKFMVKAIEKVNYSIFAKYISKDKKENPFKIKN